MLCYLQPIPGLACPLAAGGALIIAVGPSGEKQLGQTRSSASLWREGVPDLGGNSPGGVRGSVEGACLIMKLLTLRVAALRLCPLA